MTSNTQDTINQRIKFLIEQLGLSVRKFSTELGVSDTNTRNYIDRGSKPNSEYLEKLLRHFNDINPTWLLLGEGEPFLPTDSTSTLPPTNDKNFINKISGSNNSGINQGYKNQGVSAEHQKDLALAAANEKIALLTSQLADKERTIQILLKQQP